MTTHILWMTFVTNSFGIPDRLRGPVVNMQTSSGAIARVVRHLVVKRKKQGGDGRRIERLHELS